MALAERGSYIAAQVKDHSVLPLRFVIRVLAWFMVVAALAGIAVQQPTAATYVALGQTAAQHLEWRRALGDFRAAATLDDNAAAPYIGMAQIWFLQGKSQAAGDAIKQATRRAPTSLEAWLLAGQIAAQAGDDAAALADWRRTVRLAPQASIGLSAATLAVDILLRRGLPDQALALITSLPQITAQLHWDEALTLLHLGQSERSRSVLAALPAGTIPAPYLVATQAPGTARDDAALGYADLATGRPVLAIAPLRAALAADAAYGGGHAYLAWALWQAGQHDAARAQIALAVRQSPADPVTVGTQALITGADGHPAQALAVLRAWLATHDATAALWAIIATLATTANDPATAEDAWWHLATTAAIADRPAATFALARFYLATSLGRDDGRAAWAIATAQALNPQDAATTDLVAQWDVQTGHPDQALAALRHAIALDPRLASAHAHLGALEFRMGDLTAATIELEHAVDLDTTGAQASLIGPLLAILGYSVA